MLSKKISLECNDQTIDIQKLRNNSVAQCSTSADDSSQDSNQSVLRSKCQNKEKLQLCRKYAQSGFCPYYNRCKFAHGSHQLRKNNRANVRYKTKKCGSFFIDGFCHYGDRCNFLHRKKYTEKKHTQKSLMIMNFDFLAYQTKKQSSILKIIQENN